MVGLEKVLYSTEWASDLAVGSAILNLLADELSKRGVEFKLTYMKGETVGLDFNVKELKDLKGDSDVYKCIVVKEEVLAKANETLDYVHQNRRKELRQQAVEFAKQSGYIKTDDEAAQYGKDLSEAYGW